MKCIDALCRENLQIRCDLETGPRQLNCVFVGLDQFLSSSTTRVPVVLDWPLDRLSDIVFRNRRFQPSTEYTGRTSSTGVLCSRSASTVYWYQETNPEDIKSVVTVTELALSPVYIVSNNPFM